jgi:hypothetical protein
MISLSSAAAPYTKVCRDQRGKRNDFEIHEGVAGKQKGQIDRERLDERQSQHGYRDNL